MWLKYFKNDFFFLCKNAVLDIFWAQINSLGLKRARIEGSKVFTRILFFVSTRKMSPLKLGKLGRKRAHQHSCAHCRSKVVSGAQKGLLEFKKNCTQNGSLGLYIRGSPNFKFKMSPLKLESEGLTGAKGLKRVHWDSNGRTVTTNGSLWLKRAITVLNFFEQKNEPLKLGKSVLKRVH